jgi:hypothetical protein
MLLASMKARSILNVAAFIVLAIVWTRPLVFHLSSRIPHDPGDPVFNTWIVWWNAHAIPFSGRWWNPPVFHPMQGALALSEHLAGLGVITTPIQVAGGNAVAAYNTAFILSFALSGLFAFLLTRYLLAASGADPFTTGAGALCAALAYGFGPYRAGQLAHLQVLTSEWMPLALLAMHRYVDAGQKRWLLAFAFAWIVQALSNGYYLMFFPILLLLWLAWFVDWTRPARGIALTAAWIATSLLLVPPLLKYSAIQKGLGVTRTPEEMTLFSAKATSFLQAPEMLAFWRSPMAAATTEESLFPGLTLVALVAAGCLVASLEKGQRDRSFAERSPFVFYLVAALVMWALALGPGAWWRPYSLLAWLPGFEALRVPARFAMLATLCASIAAGLSFARLSPHARGARRVVAGVAIAGLCIDGWLRPMPLASPPGRVMLPPVRDAIVLELPADEGIVDVGAMYRQTQHRLPIVNGYSGHTPPHYRILGMAIRRGDPSAILEIAGGHALVISVNETLDRDGAIRRLVEGLPGIEARSGSSGGAMFVLPPSAVRRTAPPGDPWSASITSAGEEAVLDLGEPRTVRTVGFPLRWHYAELATRLTIDASLDRANWSTVWDDWTGAPVVGAALLDPVVVPVRLTLPDVRARYLRVRPAPRWMQREIAAYSPR